MPRPFEYLPEADYKLLVLALREDKSYEYKIEGWQAIGEWLARFKFTDHVMRPCTLTKWHRKFGLPIYKPVMYWGKRSSGVPMTTNLLLQAWLVTEGRALTLPRWSPFRERVERKFSSSPGAVYRRRLRESKRLARILAEGAELRRDSAGSPSAGAHSDHRTSGTAADVAPATPRR